MKHKFNVILKLHLNIKPALQTETPFFASSLDMAVFK